jgi:hypothetical protein
VSSAATSAAESRMSNDRGTAVVPLGAPDVGGTAIEGHYTGVLQP